MQDGEREEKRGKRIRRKQGREGARVLFISGIPCLGTTQPTPPKTQTAMTLDFKGAAAAFFDDFKRDKESILATLQTTPLVAKSALYVHFDSLLTRINDLQKRLTEATIYLPSYDERQFILQIRSLTDELNNLRAEYTPKQKFTFKSRKAARATGPKEPAAPAAAVDATSTTDGKVPSMTSASLSLSVNRHVFSNQNHQILTLPPLSDASTRQDLQAIDCALSDLTGSLVLLLDPSRTLGAIHIRNLHNCVVIAGPVSGSTLIYDCSDCVFVLACHQFRMHSSIVMDIYLHVTSHPIIEDCTDIRFGTYTVQHPNLEAMFKAVNLPPTPTHYTVEDFNWLKKQASPNWRLLTEDEERKEWPTDVVAGENEEALAKELVERYGRRKEAE